MKKGDLRVPAETPGVLAAAIFSALIGSAAALILSQDFVYSSHTVQVVLAGLLILVGSLGLIWQIALTIQSRVARVDIFSPAVFFPLLYSFFYGVGSVIYAQRYQIIIPTNEYILYFVGLFAYLIGALVASRLPRPQGRPRDFAIVWHPRRLQHVIFGLFLLGTVAFVYAVSQTGVPVLSINVETDREIVAEVGGYITYFMDSIQIVIMLLFLYGFTQSKATFKNPIWVGLLFFSVLMLAVLGNRRNLATPLIVALILYHYLRKQLSLKTVVVIGTTTFLLIVLAGSARLAGSFQVEQDAIIQALSTEIGRGASALSRLSQFFPAEFDFFGWKGALLPFLALTPGRQKLLGLILKEDIFGLSFRGGGWVPTILGWFYVNFGSPGIYVGMPLMGFLIGATYRWMRRNKNDFSVILYSFIATIYINALRSGFISLWPIYVVGVLYISHMYCRLQLKPIRVATDQARSTVENSPEVGTPTLSNQRCSS